MNRPLASLALVAALAAGPAFAHGKDGVHLKGTVKAVAAATLTVATTDGKEQVVTVDANTRYARGDLAVAFSDVDTGEKVVVHAKRAKGGALRAELVKLPRRAPPPESPKATP